MVGEENHIRPADASLIFGKESVRIGLATLLFGSLLGSELRANLLNMP